VKTERLICVSNRLPTGDAPSGGLVVALADVLAETGGTWVGWSGASAGTASAALAPVEGGPFRRLAFDLTDAEVAGYYAGYANAVLWPILHARADLMDIVHEDLAVYKAVNRRLAGMLIDVIAPDDIVWVHDFHLLPLAWELRALGAANRIGLFLHTPFPAPQDMAALPNAGEVAGWLSQHDLVGLQTEADVRKFRASLSALAEARAGEDGIVELGRRATRVAAFPISIDTREFAELAVAEHRSLPPGIVKPDRALVIGVDRLDYTKGLPQRFRAFAAFLERHEDWHRHVSLLQISPPTREGVAAYDAIRDETEALAGRINGQFADITWAPIRYIHRHVARERLAGLYRAARVALVTPLMDGMNLVAKEYVAAQDPADPGVLVLSQFAGAAEQMQDALQVNPHDIEQVAAAIHSALVMPPRERRRRQERLMEGLLAQDVHWWSAAFLTALRGPRPSQPSA
jgi:trehalose 6-phosphate synthase